MRLKASNNCECILVVVFWICRKTLFGILLLLPSKRDALPKISDDIGMNRQVLKLAEVQVRLGVSRWTLYSWLQTGRIHGFKLPCGHYRVPESEVNAIKDSRVQNGQELGKNKA